MEMGLLVQLHNYYQDLICTEEATPECIKKAQTIQYVIPPTPTAPKCLGTLKKKQNFFFPCRKL